MTHQDLIWYRGPQIGPNRSKTFKIYFGPGPTSFSQWIPDLNDSDIFGDRFPETVILETYYGGDLSRLRVVHTQDILFLKSMSERGGSDIE